MIIKVFGKELFSTQRSGELLFGNARNEIKESKWIPDFYKYTQRFDSEPQNMYFAGDLAVTTPTPVGGTTTAAITGGVKKNVKEEPKTPVIEKTPKEVYELKMLNDPAFKMNVEPKYVQEQIDLFKEKLSLLKSSDYDMGNGVTEVASILMRLENRLKYSDHHKYFDDFPYTSSIKIKQVIKDNDYLKIGYIDQFVPDLPKEAIKTMSEYKKHCVELCGKNPIFYIIANKKDFEKTEKRKDPILLAQSPFGHFWQILGAWDKEMTLLEEL